MKITIIREDQAVYVDGVSFASLDLSFMDQTIHAVQWKDTKGWIEYVDTDDGTKLANEPIEDFAPFQSALDAWNVAKQAHDSAISTPVVPAGNQPTSNGTQVL